MCCFYKIVRFYMNFKQRGSLDRLARLLIDGNAMDEDVFELAKLVVAGISINFLCFVFELA